MVDEVNSNRGKWYSLDEAEEDLVHNWSKILNLGEFFYKNFQESRAEERRRILRKIAFTFEEEYSIYNYDERRREEEEEEDIDFHEVDKYDEKSDQE